MSNAQIIWNYLKSKGLNDYGIAGLMGNLYAESGLIPTNLQQTYENSLGYTDATYTAAVDSGRYSKNSFVDDKAGYGLAQWTFKSRKEALWKYAKEQGKSIGDLYMQLDFLWKELNESFPSVLNILFHASSVREASNSVLIDFERPAKWMEEKTQNDRCEFGQRYYDQFAAKQTQDMSAEDFTDLFNQLRNGLRNNDCSEYSREARNWAISIGLIVGSGTLENGEPNYMWRDFLTREQFATVLYRFFQWVNH